LAASFAVSFPFELEDDEEDEEVEVEEEEDEEEWWGASGEWRWFVVPCGNNMVVVEGVEWMVAGGMCTCDMWRGCWWRMPGVKWGRRGRWGRRPWLLWERWVARGMWGRRGLAKGKFAWGTCETAGLSGCVRGGIDGTWGRRAEREDEEEEWVEEEVWEEDEWEEEEEEEVEEEEDEDEEEGAEAGGVGRRKRAFSLNRGGLTG
jgi:hypothetical protein